MKIELSVLVMPAVALPFTATVESIPPFPVTVAGELAVPDKVTLNFRKYYYLVTYPIFGVPGLLEVTQALCALPCAGVPDNLRLPLIEV